jgi:hypothetical protein
MPSTSDGKAVCTVLPEYQAVRDRPLMRLQGVDEHTAELLLYEERVECMRRKRCLFFWRRHTATSMAYRDVKRAVFREGPRFGAIMLEDVRGTVINVLISGDDVGRAELLIRERVRHCQHHRSS